MAKSKGRSKALKHVQLRLRQRFNIIEEKFIIDIEIIEQIKNNSICIGTYKSDKNRKSYIITYRGEIMQVVVLTKKSLPLTVMPLHFGNLQKTEKNHNNHLTFKNT